MKLHRHARPDAGVSSSAAPIADTSPRARLRACPAHWLIYQRCGRSTLTISIPCPGCVRQGRFAVTVAGKRYGKGSSREHSPAAEKFAGVRLVVAESFERIYRQNADNIGLFTSTDFGLIERIQRGEAIAVDELVAGRDALAAAILRCGGLLRFGQCFMQGVASVADAGRDAGVPRTLFEKIVARHALATELTAAHAAAGQGAFVRADWRFIHEYYTGMAAHMLDAEFGESLSLQDPPSIVVFEDHTSYVHESTTHVRAGLVPNVLAMCAAQRAFAARFGLRMHRTLTEDEARLDDGSNVAGISHAMVAEHYALPGQVVVGTDSHTPHSGALGCVAFGVGTTDMANAFVTGAVRLTVPESLRIVLGGAVPAGVTAKDIVLHLLALPAIRAGTGLGKVFEFGGPAVASLSTDERATLTNMTAELGGFTGIVAPDAETVRFLRERRGVDFMIEPWMHSDPGARYAETITVDCSALTPCWRARAIRVTACHWGIWPSPSRCISPTGARAPQASARTSTSTTACCTGPCSAACAWRRMCSCSCSLAPRPCATTAWPGATCRCSSRSARACCSPPAGPAATAGRGRPPPATKSR